MKAKQKKGKEGAQNPLAPSGAQVIDPASSSAPVKSKKRNDEPSAPAKRGTQGQNTIEYRLDYVCNFLGIKKDVVKDQSVLDFCLDDIGRMDFVSHFVNLKELVLINQGTQQIEGLDRCNNLEKVWITHNFLDSIKCFDKLRNVR